MRPPPVLAAAALAVLGVVAASGCFEPCPYTTAGWTDPEVFGAMRIAEEEWLGDAGWALQDAGLDARWGRYAVAEVVHEPPGRDDGLRMFAGFQSGLHVTDPRPSVLVTADGDGAGIGAEVDRFVALLAPSPQAAADVRAALDASRTEARQGCARLNDCPELVSIQMRADLPDGWGPQGAWDALPGLAAAAELPDPWRDDGKPRWPGQSLLGGGGWTFRFQLPVRSDADGFSADPEGHVLLHLWEGRQSSAEAFRDVVRAEVARHGLASPPDGFPVEREFCRF